MKWNENLTINNLIHRGIRNDSDVKFTFSITSHDEIKINELKILFDSFFFELEVVKRVDDFQLNGQTEKMKFEELCGQINTIIGWLFSHCSDKYCELKTCGIVL